MTENETTLRCRYCGKEITTDAAGTCDICDRKYAEGPTKREDGRQMTLATIAAIKEAAIQAHYSAAKVFSVAFSNIHVFDNAKWSLIARNAGELRDALKSEYEDAVRLYNRENGLEGEQRVRRDLQAIFYTSWTGPSAPDSEG